MSILSHADYRGGARFETDVVVVGTGAGGAVAGAELAVAQQRLRCRPRIAGAAADGEHRVLGLDHVTVAREHQRGALVGDDEQLRDQPVAVPGHRRDLIVEGADSLLQSTRRDPLS